MLHIALLDMTSTPVAWHWEGDGHGAPSCVVVWQSEKKRVWPVGEFCSTKLSRKCVLPLYCHCHGNYAASSISDQNWIKNRDPLRKSIRFTLEPQGLTGKWTSEWMNTNLWSPCLFVSSWSFLSARGLLLRKKSIEHDFAFCLSILALKFLTGTWMVPSKYSIQTFSRNRHLKNTPPDRILMIWSYFVYFLEIFLNIFANQRKEDSLATPSFLRSIRTFWSSLLELNSGSSLHLYRSLSLFYTRCAPFRAWKCSQPRPAALQCYRSPLLCHFEYLQRNNVGQMLSMEVCALLCSLQAWLRNV